MDQRFTFKDFFLFAFLALLLVMIVLSMYMVDRQWEKMAAMQRTMTEQAGDLRDCDATLMLWIGVWRPVRSQWRTRLSRRQRESQRHSNAHTTRRRLRAMREATGWCRHSP